MDPPHDRAPSSRVTQLLVDWGNGDREALEELTPLVYQELRRLAHYYMRRERPGHLLQTTALVHEAYLRLVGSDIEWQGRVHFFAVASSLMRRILVDFARRRQADKRGGGLPVLSLDDAAGSFQPAANAPQAITDLIRLDDALKELAAFDERKSRVVDLRFFGGLTIDQTASILGVSHATVERDLKLAKAWLRRELDAG